MIRRTRKFVEENLTWKERLGFVLVGCWAAFYGYGMILRGRPIYTTLRGQDTTADFAIFLGGLLILMGVVPRGWINRRWPADGKKKDHR
jgi:hypothetical protein